MQIFSLLLFLSIIGHSLPSLVPFTKVYLCITGRTVHASTVNSVFNLLEAAKEYADIRIIPDVRSSSDLPQLRSSVLSEWYDTSEDTDIFVFLDNDISFLPVDFFRLLNCKADVCGGVLSLGDSNMPNAKFLDQKWNIYGENELAHVGTAFMAIKRPILRRVMEILKDEIDVVRVTGIGLNYVPFFHQLITNPDGKQTVWMGEDVSFCYRVRKAGGVVKGINSNTMGHEKFKQFVWNPTTRKRDEL